MTSVDSNFNFLCGRPHGAGPPVHMRPPEPDPLPLRVDVINGWPFKHLIVVYSGFNTDYGSSEPLKTPCYVMLILRVGGRDPEVMGWGFVGSGGLGRRDTGKNPGGPGGPGVWGWGLVGRGGLARRATGKNPGGPGRQSGSHFGRQGRLYITINSQNSGTFRYFSSFRVWV